ncbi:transcriptional regulator PpsR [Jannaschia seohaensis]|uniref:Transcriptional regulator PpsR n=1 Tax=Jannaschia seohaensis TaxID=475081 RepID=A0A2Y9A5X6_9RHOB|nr:transcriptional regulator PpsR [Jannaschia seohaensis]PWJ21711.1 transcriptional regulator PpsR [Jannaschia seohaensis]SSA37989.1 transcriptional regulator PpsR [Jannaschia seohaensis]
MNTRESDFWNERSGPRIAPEHFGEIVATAADIALVVGEGGTIISFTTNPLNSAIGRIDHWEGRPITDFLSADSTAKVTRQIAATIRGEERPTAIEVNHVDGAAWDFPVRYTTHLTGRDGRVLMLGRDLRPLAELQQRLVRAQIAIEKDYEQQRIYETRYRVLLEATREAVVLVEAASGRMLDVSDAAARLLGSDRGTLTGGAFTQEFTGRRRSEFMDALSRASGEERGHVVASLRDGREVTLRPVLFRNAGDRVLLCRIERANTPAQAEDVALEALFDGAREAIVLTDGEGRIQRANDSFLTMMEIDSLTELRGRTLSELLVRGGVDLKVLHDGGQAMPLATRLVTRFGSHLPVEVTCAGPIGAGHGYVFRESSRSAALDGEAAPSDGLNGLGADASRVQMLVGSAPLRDIVASMTDVIEKQCIETAIELTDNNRVAAAEMLGLSRQSLYVKLRKYGLLQRDET